MEFIDLKAQYIKLKAEIDANILEVCNKSQFIMGPQVKELENQLAEYVGVKNCITCGNGTDALTLALMAYDIGKGDAVFVPTFTFYASAETVSLRGATPIFVDVDRDTFNISTMDLEKAIVEVIEKKELRVRAIIAVDLFGLPADFKRINLIAEKYNLLVIEDGAQGFGGSVYGKQACSFGDIATTSFFPAKPLGCYGDGGAIFTNDEKIKLHLESLRIHGKGEDKYDNVRVGLNSRLDTLQAAVLLAKLKAFKEYELDARNKIAKIYDELLRGRVTTPVIPAGHISSYAQYSIVFEHENDRDIYQEKLKNIGVPTMIYYKKCMHQQTVYRNNTSIYRNFSNAEFVSKMILNLPIHPYMTEEDCRKVLI